MSKKITTTLLLLLLVPWGWARADQSPLLQELEKSGLPGRFGLSLTADAPVTRSGGDGIDSLLVVAWQRNPRLRRSYEDYQAALEAVAGATSLPDPKLAYTRYLQPVETRVGPQRSALSVSQSFPWFGSLSLQGEAAREKAAAARAVFLNTALEVRAAVQKAVYDRQYLQQALTITEQHQGLLVQWEDVAQARYRAGSGSYADVIKAQVELGILDDRLAGFRQQDRALLAVLNALLDQPLDKVVGLDPEPQTKIFELNLPLLQQKMAAENPLLEAWDHRAAASLKRNQLATRQGRPSFTLGVNYIMTDQARNAGVPDSGRDALMASLAVSVPLWRGKYESAAKVAVSGYRGALASRQNQLNNLGAQLEQAHFQYDDARRKIELYQTALLPKGRQSLAATRASYEVGKSSFLDLMDAQRAVLEFDLTLTRARVDARIQAAIMEKLVAGSLAQNPSDEEK